MGMRGICELNLKSLNGQSLSLYCAGDAGLGDHSPNPFIDQLITASTPKASASPRPKQVPPIESASPDLAAAPSPRLLPRGQMASDPPCAGSPQSTQVSTLRSRINNARFGQISDKLPATSAAVAVANILGFNSQTPKGLNAASPRAATAAAAASAKYEVKAKSEEELLRLKEVPEVRANPLRRSLTTGVLETGRKDGKDAKEAPEAPQARQEAVVQEADLREMTTELEELAEAEVQNHDAIRQKVVAHELGLGAQPVAVLCWALSATPGALLGPLGHSRCSAGPSLPLPVLCWALSATPGALLGPLCHSRCSAGPSLPLPVLCWALRCSAGPSLPLPVLCWASNRTNRT